MTDVPQNNRTSFSDHCHGSEKQNSAVWTVLKSQNNRTSLSGHFHGSERQSSAVWTVLTSQNNRTSLSDHFHGSERQSSAIWTGFVEQTTSASPCVGREHWAVRLRLGAVLKRSSQAAFRFSDLLFPGRALQDWARHRPFDHISQAAGGQFGLAKFALWRDSISPGQAVCIYWRTGTSYSNFQLWSQGHRWNWSFRRRSRSYVLTHGIAHYGQSQF